MSRPRNLYSNGQSSDSIANRIMELEGEERKAYIARILNTENGEQNLESARRVLSVLRDSAISTLDMAAVINAFVSTITLDDPETVNMLAEKLSIAEIKTAVTSAYTDDLIKAIDVINDALDEKLHEKTEAFKANKL